MQKEISPMKAPVLSLKGLCNKTLVFACEKMVKLCRFVIRFCQCEQNWLYLNPVEGYMDINLLI